MPGTRAKDRDGRNPGTGNAPVGAARPGAPGGAGTYIAHQSIVGSIPYIDLDFSRNCILGCPNDKEMYVVFKGLYYAVLQTSWMGLLDYRKNQVESSFARVGIFPGKKAAIIDSSIDYYNSSSLMPPVFEVWTGTPYDFDQDGDYYLITEPDPSQYNQYAKLEVADNPDFVGAYSTERYTSANYISIPMSIREFLRMRGSKKMFYRVSTYNRIIQDTQRDSNTDMMLYAE